MAKFSSDGNYIFTGGSSNFYLIISAKTNKVVFKSVLPEETDFPSLDIDLNGVYSVATTRSSIESNLLVYNIDVLNINPGVKLKNMNDKLAPQILVSNPPIAQNPRPVVNKEMIDIRGTVVDDHGVMRFTVNGQPVPTKENGNFVVYIPLAMGENNITIEATDLSENTSLKKIVVVRKNELEKYDAANAKNHLLVIGINNYTKWPVLNNAVRDAQDVAKVLLQDYTFERENTTILLDSNASKNAVIKTLRSYIEKVTPSDNLVIYFSGHGFFDELLNEGYWVPADAELGQEGDYVPNSTISKILANIHGKHIFLVADACFSGSLFSEASRGYTENVEKVKSRWGFTSGRLEKVSDGQEGANSPFAESFITFLQDNPKEKCHVSELIQSVKVKVAEKSNQTPIGNPLRNVGDEGGEFVFTKKAK